MGNLRKIQACPQQVNLLLTKCYNMNAMHLTRCVPPTFLEGIRLLAAMIRILVTVWARPIYGLNFVPFGEASPPVLAAALARARLLARHSGFGVRSLHAGRDRDAAVLASLPVPGTPSVREPIWSEPSMHVSSRLVLTRLRR